MDTLEKSLAFAEEFAKHLTEWVPELENRALAVSEADPFTPDTTPRLPLAIVAMVSENYEAFPTITMDFVVEIMLPPTRYEKSDGSDSPFWAYYDYTGIRDQILAGIETLGGIRPIQLEIEASALAVYLSFRMRRQTKWCAPDPLEQAPAARISAKIIPAAYFYNSQPPEKEGDNAAC